MRLNSYYHPLSLVVLPPFQGRQHYMHTFQASAPSVPAGFEDYLPVVRTLLAAAGVLHGECHLTVDEKVVPAGRSQRRPGPHVDGCFVPSAGKWGHDSEGPRWAHSCNNIGLRAPARMPVIVASSVPGCKVWWGSFYGEPKSDGDCSHIELGDRTTVLAANRGYLLSSDCVHESMLMEQDTQRTFLRIALPNTYLV